MKVFSTEHELMTAPDFPAKPFLVSVVRQSKAGFGDESMDLLADCGQFYVIEDGDDVTALSIVEGGGEVDLTDPDRMTYEFSAVSEDGKYFALFWLVSNAGGPVFFIPRTDSMLAAFQRVMPE